MKCFEAKCVFHKGKDSCLLPESENFFVTDEDKNVKHCINRIYCVNELSKEGKIKLRRLKNG